MTFGFRVVTDADGRIEFKQREGGKKHFHIAVFVDEPEGVLDTIRMVEYHLHETFKVPIRHNDERRSRFEEHFFTWGKFTVVALVLFDDGRMEKFSFYLDYQLPPDYGLNYVQVPMK